MRVFISYKRDVSPDEPLALALYEHLRGSHEVFIAHVAQFYRAGGICRNSEPLGIQVDPAKTHQHQLDSALYKGPLSDKAIELEAFTVGALPEWAPKIFDHYCK